MPRGRAPTPAIVPHCVEFRAPFVSTVIGAAVDLASCTTALLEIIQGMRRPPQGRALDGQSQTSLARSAFVANVVCPGTAFESAALDRIQRVLLRAAPPWPSSRSSRSGAEQWSKWRHSRGLRGTCTWAGDLVCRGSFGGTRSHTRAQCDRTGDSHLPRCPIPIRMAVNPGPDTFCSSELVDLLETGAPNRMVVELTNTSASPTTRRFTGHVRDAAIGAEVAIDDTGTGYRASHGCWR